MSDLVSLKVRRGHIKGQLTRFSTHVNKETVDPFEIKCRGKKMKELWSEFDQVQSEIESFDDETDDYRVEFEEMYFSAMALGESQLQRSTKYPRQQLLSLGQIFWKIKIELNLEDMEYFNLEHGLLDIYINLGH
ncbi:hypothetical protein ACI65C_011499 [Semiaphis heraclei]